MSADSHAELIALEEKAALLEPSTHVVRDRPRRHRLSRWTVGALLLTVLALALGLGLGLGLKHHRDSSAPTTSPSTSPPHELQPTPQEHFVLGGLAGQSPQTRTYDFVVSQVHGAPDGVRKPMLVVNGMYPGPTIEANQGDRIVVNVTNLLENRTTIHWHGLVRILHVACALWNLCVRARMQFQNQTNYYDGTAAITECGIPPGQSLVYKYVP